MFTEYNESRAAIRPVRPQDGPAIRELTLKMLADSPQAYGLSLEKARARTTSQWLQLAEDLADTDHHCGFIAEDFLGLCGFVRGDSTDPRLPPGAALAAQLWVAPRHRGTGLGERLMDAVTGWAGERGAAMLALGVFEENRRARGFYEHLDYVDTGRREPSPLDSTRKIVVMARVLET